MTWDDVIEQRHVVEVLRRAVTSGRVPHAYLFHGPDGTGKRAAALTLARTLQCEQGGDAPCEACNPCRKVRKMIHPDVHVLFPYPSDADEREVAVRLEHLAEEPYATIDFARRPSLEDPTRSSNKQTLYQINRVHEDLFRPMSFKPAEGAFKIAILTDADAMNVQAANAFLKLLEEPPPQTLFILTTPNAESLLPTIISRCQRLRFDLLDAAAIEQALVARKQVSPEHAAMIARMADGSFSRALDLMESEELAASREQVVEFLRRAYSMDVQRMSEIIDWMNGLGRESIKGVLTLMLSWIRDLLLYRTAGREAVLVNVDQTDAIARFCENLPAADLAGMASAVEEAIGLVERNVRIDWIMTALGYLLHHAMRGRPAGRLYIPLSEVA